MTDRTQISPLVAPLLSDFLVAVVDLAGRPEVDHTVTHWADRHHRLLAATARLDGQVVFDTINSALVELGCCTEDAVGHADEARYLTGCRLRHSAYLKLHTAVYVAAEELVGTIRGRWLDLDPVLDMVAANLRNATALEGSPT